MASIIIPVHNHSALTRACIEKVREQSDCPVFLVDDASETECAVKLEQIAKDLSAVYVKNSVNKGFAASVNKGIDLAGRDDVIILNNDCFVEPEAICTLVESLKVLRGIIGVKLLYNTREIQHAGTGFFGLTPAHIGVGASEHELNELLPRLAVTFAFVGIARETIDILGPLCEDYFIAYEDVDYCLRARQKGISVIYQPEAKAVHLEGYTRGNKPETKNPYWYKKELEGRKLFLERWSEYIEAIARESASV